MSAFRTLDGVDVKGKRVLVREDFNVPLQDGEVSDDTRLRVALPTIRRLRDGGAKTILISHFDRPKGKRVPSMSLKPVVATLAKLIGAPVAFAEDCVGETADKAVAALKDGEVLLLQNLRFHAGEEADDESFARQLAANGDLYVDDAFSAAHRAHASNDALAKLLPAYAGEAMRRELSALDAALGSPKRPVLGIVGGSKVATKLELLHNLVLKLDRLAIGGGMANTFLFAQGWDVGGFLLREGSGGHRARGIMAFAERRGCELLLPIDIVVAEQAHPGAAAQDARAGRDRSARAHPRCGTQDRGAALQGDGRGEDVDLERPPRCLRGAAVRQGNHDGCTTRRGAGQGRETGGGRWGR